MVLHRFYVSGDQNIDAKATKNLPQEKYNKSSKKKPPKLSCLTQKLEIDLQSEVQRYPNISINPAPDHPGIPRWPRQPQKVAQKLKRCILDMKMMSQMLQNYHPRLPNDFEVVKKDKKRKQRWHCL